MKSMLQTPENKLNIYDEPGLAFDNGHDNTELANALLSLSARYAIPDVLDPSFKDSSPYVKPDCIPMAAAAPPTYGLAGQPAASLQRANAWMGGSAAALFGYPYSSYGIDPVAFCSCATRAGPSLPGWKSYQQSGVPEFSTVSSGMHQPAIRYPQPLHHPLIFAANTLQQNMQKYSPIESRSSLTLPIHPQHQAPIHDQVPSMQQQLASKPLKINTDITSPPSCMKQDSPTRSSVAVVAPLIVEFNQKNQMPGIPLIYNVNQWLNVPSCGNDTMASATVKPESSVTQMQQHDYINTQMSCASWQSNAAVQRKKDAICQLGEAANMILQCQEAKPTPHQHTLNQNSNSDRKHYQSCCAAPSVIAADLNKPNSPELNNRIAQTAVIDGQATDQASAPKNLKNRTCPYCQKVFARPFTLKSHIRRHTKEKPYVCKICQRCFSQNATLENHKLIHTGAKPHQCSVCMKRFAHQTSLKTHLRIHTGEQPYECEFCSRRFTDGSTLQKHKRTHSGDKPFPCRFCQKCFSQSGNMRRHMTTTHKDELRMEEASKTSILKHEGVSNNSKIL